MDERQPPGSGTTWIALLGLASALLTVIALLEGRVRDALIAGCAVVAAFAVVAFVRLGKDSESTTGGRTLRLWVKRLASAAGSAVFAGMSVGAVGAAVEAWQRGSLVAAIVVGALALFCLAAAIGGVVALLLSFRSNRGKTLSDEASL